MKDYLDKVLSQKNPVYNIANANCYFSRLKSEITNKAFQSPEMAENKLINTFTSDDTRGRAPAPAFSTSASPPVLAKTNEVVLQENPKFIGGTLFVN